MAQARLLDVAILPSSNPVFESNAEPVHTVNVYFDCKLACRKASKYVSSKSWEV